MSVIGVPLGSAQSVAEPLGAIPITVIAARPGGCARTG
jgi:hypothetical protein